MTKEEQFKHFTALRREQSQDRMEAKPYIVRTLKKDGSYRAETPFHLDCCMTLEAAQARKADLERMNPHNRYAIEGA